MTVIAESSGKPIERKAIRPLATGEVWLQRGLVVFAVTALVVGVVLPLLPLVGKSLTTADGEFVGLANYIQYFTSPGLSSSLVNSLTVAAIATVIALAMAFAYAYSLTMTTMRGKRAFRLIAFLPLLAPSLALGIGLVYLFGKKGLITYGLPVLLGQNPIAQTGAHFELYGIYGIIMGEVLFCFPQAFIILLVAASLADARLYEASSTLRASGWRTFVTVTLPNLRYGIISAAFVCFTLVFTDFGVPKVLGGNYNVLATDIYKQVIGQQNFSMGATISIILLIPTVLAYLIDRQFQHRHSATFGSRGVPYRPKPNKRVDLLAFAVCAVIAAYILSVIGAVFLASVMNVWPYKLDLTLRHFDFSKVGGGGWNAYWNSLQMSFYTALFGTVVTFVCAYLFEKTKVLGSMRSFGYLLAMIPIALPGMVIGLAYIFFFNPRAWQIGPWMVPNPFSFLYATMAILVISNIVHFFTVSFMTATTSLKQLDPEYEAVSTSLRVPFYKTFWRITVPLCVVAVYEIGSFYFVNAMVTVSAVIFLYSPQLKLASVAIVNMDDAGDTASAAAMSVLIILTSLFIRGAYDIGATWLHRRTQAWRTEV